MSKDERTNPIMQMLNQCMNSLLDEWIECANLWSSLPPVLCHMVLQPQNLAFYHHAEQRNDNDAKHVATDCHVAAVMDWEEACYADPRFELMLLCRKVLANRAQADAVWNLYSKQVQLWRDEFRSRWKEEVYWDVGPIEPWLKLVYLVSSAGGWTWWW